MSVDPGTDRASPSPPAQPRSRMTGTSPKQSRATRRREYKSSCAELGWRTPRIERLGSSAEASIGPNPDAWIVAEERSSGL